MRAPTIRAPYGMMPEGFPALPRPRARFPEHLAPAGQPLSREEVMLGMTFRRLGDKNLWLRSPFLSTERSPEASRGPRTAAGEFWTFGVPSRDCLRAPPQCSSTRAPEVPEFVGASLPPARTAPNRWREVQGPKNFRRDGHLNPIGRIQTVWVPATAGVRGGPGRPDP